MSKSAYISAAAVGLALVAVVALVVEDVQAQQVEYIPMPNQAGFYFRPRSASFDSSVELGGGRVELPIGWNRRFGKRADRRRRRLAVLDSLGGRDFLIR
ncbi:unnamed protein product [Bursaphelenchus xylophilus]|uniref:(pine wood nematode) hypothetical protein n=1 Tax=Bursaphelenchus xylophilus TaxID=6326 RepID=A0A1I7SV59_BURXY|nr:unnamed protein product [Bursaphelenchus xylophilus]CAG9100937.1 unnamed protein product [Bursaphelenchus xylophilus]